MLAVSIGLTLGLAEGALRLVPERLPEEVQLRLHYTQLREGKTRSIGDPYLGFVYLPNAQGEIHGADVSFQYTTDEHGFRNPSPWPSEVDVVTVGDSMVFGFGLPDGSTWARRLGARLPGGMVNLGLPGMAPEQYSRVYERFGAALRPELLLYALFPGNDLNDARDFQRWLEKGSPGNFAVWRAYRGAGLTPAEGLQRLVRHSYLLTLIDVVRHRPKLSFEGRTVELSSGERIQLAPSLLVNNEKLARPGPVLDLVMDAVESARALARESSTEFLVLLFPTKEEVYLPVLGEPTPRLIASMVEALEQRGIPYLDLTPPFQERARAGERLFFEIDGHPNEAGSRLIADFVLEHVRGRVETD